MNFKHLNVRCQQIERECHTNMDAVDSCTTLYSLLSSSKRRSNRAFGKILQQVVSNSLSVIVWIKFVLYTFVKFMKMILVFFLNLLFSLLY